MAKVATHKDRTLQFTYKPSAVVTRARFIGDNGNHPGVLGSKANAIAQDSWTQADIDRAAVDLSGNAKGLTGTLLGFEELEVDNTYAVMGTELTADASNRGTAAASGHWVNAILYSASTAAGDRVTALKIIPYLKA